MDNYYNINVDIYEGFPRWLEKDCKKIQRVMADKGIYLTLAECKVIYHAYSDECFCSSWNAYIEDCSDEDLFEIVLYWLENILLDRANRIDDIINNLYDTEYGERIKKGLEEISEELEK